MPRVDFLISNPGHHLAMVRPVLETVRQRDRWECRIVSLCEFRGFSTPIEELRRAEIECRPLGRRRFRSSSALHQARVGGSPTALRRIVRELAWHAVLARPVRAVLDEGSDLVVVPNDAAFPYERIVRQLRARSIAFVLMQEGVRLAVPRAEEAVYGAGGPRAVAAWGEASAEYFRSVGVPSERIAITGNPRFDAVLATDWLPAAEHLRRQHGLGDNVLLLVTNPIDDLGLCSTREKTELVRRFLEDISELVMGSDLQLAVRPHPREDAGAYRRLARRVRCGSRVRVLDRAPLYPSLRMARAAVVLASTVGLEALLLGVPLGVLDIPGTGFAYDYVSSGAALGLSWREPMTPQVKGLLASGPLERRGIDAYLKRQLDTSGRATDRVAAVIEGVVDAH